MKKLYGFTKTDGTHASITACGEGNMVEITVGVDGVSLTAEEARKFADFVMYAVADAKGGQSEEA